MRQKTAKFIFEKIMGWKMLKSVPPQEKKCVILGVPHTTFRDFVVFYFYTRAMGDSMNVFVKHTFFFWPLGPLMKMWGAIPVNREKGTSLLKEYYRIFQERDYIHLALAPEGTRNPIAKWKLGFHAIAHSAGVPVYLGYFNWKKKEITYGERFEVSDDAMADLRAIQQHYKKQDLAAYYPEKFIYMD